MYLLQYLIVNYKDFCHIFRLSFAFSSVVMSCNTQIDVLYWLDLQGDHLIRCYFIWGFKFKAKFWLQYYYTLTFNLKGPNHTFFFCEMTLQFGSLTGLFHYF